MMMTRVVTLMESNGWDYMNLLLCPRHRLSHV